MLHERAGGDQADYLMEIVTAVVNFFFVGHQLVILSTSYLTWHIDDKQRGRV